MIEAANDEVWIGLAEVQQRPGAGVLMDRTAAFVNVLAVARDEATFREAVAAALGNVGFDCIELEDPEPLRLRVAHFEVAQELLSLAHEVRATGEPRFGTFNTWISEDE
jgi:hypothetical protein